SELIDLALAALRNRDFAEAQKACHRILTDRPDQPAAWHLLGVSALEVGDSAAAIRALRRAVALRRARPEYHLTLGRAYREAGRFEEALETLRQARELAPDSPEILIQLAAVQMALGRVDEAKETSLLGSHLLLRKKAMRLRLRLAMLRVPVAALLRSLSTPRCSYAVAAALERSRILARYDELSAATASCRQAVDMAPDYAPACTALGRLMLQAGDVEGALTYLKKASDRAPEDAPTLMEYAQALLTSSRWD
ncbi:MAG: tetratricopeptide repeat protein, partial [Gammaproteobacteria bacterium]|nr:tetratricopeptide repeat protein [Gammaproteobacteria bacterium]